MMTFDWQQATKAQCKLLYGPIRQHVGFHAVEWKPFLDSIYAEMSGAEGVARPHANESEKEGLSKGKLARVKLNLIWRWLEINKPEAARQILSTLQASNSVGEPMTNRPLDPSRWPRFLEAHSSSKGVDIEAIGRNPDILAPDATPKIPDFLKAQPDKPEKKLAYGDRDAFLKAAEEAKGVESVQPMPAERVSQTVVRLGQGFRFVFDKDMKGPVLAMQKMGSPAWQLLPISGFDAHISDNEVFRFLPLERSREPKYLTEEQQTGRHSFAFIFLPDHFIPSVISAIDNHHNVNVAVLHRLVDQLENTGDSWKIMTLDVMFIL